VSEDPLGDLERELVAAARRRGAQRLSASAGSQADALSGVLAIAFVGVAIALAVGVLVLLASG
jgi:hypothetical protein